METKAINERGPFYIWHDEGRCDNMTHTIEAARQIGYPDFPVDGRC